MPGSMLESFHLKHPPCCFEMLWDVLPEASTFIHHFIPFYPCLLSTSEYYPCTLPVGCARSGCSSSSSGSILASGTSCLAMQYVWCSCLIQSCTKTCLKNSSAPWSLYHLQLPEAIQEIDKTNNQLITCSSFNNREGLTLDQSKAAVCCSDNVASCPQCTRSSTSPSDSSAPECQTE